MNKETIKVVNVGKPDIEVMSGSEQATFFSELLTKKPLSFFPRSLNEKGFVSRVKCIATQPLTANIKTKKKIP